MTVGFNCVVQEMFNLTATFTWVKSNHLGVEFTRLQINLTGAHRVKYDLRLSTSTDPLQVPVKIPVGILALTWTCKSGGSAGPSPSKSKYEIMI